MPFLQNYGIAVKKIRFAFLFLPCIVKNTRRNINKKGGKYGFSQRQDLVLGIYA